MPQTRLLMGALRLPSIQCLPKARVAASRGGVPVGAALSRPTARAPPSPATGSRVPAILRRQCRDPVGCCAARVCRQARRRPRAPSLGNRLRQPGAVGRNVRRGRSPSGPGFCPGVLFRRLRPRKRRRRSKHGPPRIFPPNPGCNHRAGSPMAGKSRSSGPPPLPGPEIPSQSGREPSFQQRPQAVWSRRSPVLLGLEPAMR